MSKKPEARQCKKCYYSTVGNEGVLTCRKNPPIGKTIEDRVCHYIFRGYWPRVKEKDWCGSYLEKPQETK